MVSQTTSRVPIKLAQVWIARKNQKTSWIVLSTKVHALKVWKQTTTVTTFEHLVTLSAPHDTTTPPWSNTTIVHIQCQVALVVSMGSCYIFSLTCLHISDVFFCFYPSLLPFHSTFSHSPRLTPSPDSSTTQKCSYRGRTLFQGWFPILMRANDSWTLVWKKGDWLKKSGGQ